MQKQIDYCADRGIAFWAFDWYYPEGKNKDVPENNALGLYLKAPNCQRLKFCLLVANHTGFRIGPKDWDACCKKWIDLFQQPSHLQLDGQPLLIFFSDCVRQLCDSVISLSWTLIVFETAAATKGRPAKPLLDLVRYGIHAACFCRSAWSKSMPWTSPCRPCR